PSAIDRRLEPEEWVVLLPGTYALTGTPATFMRRAVAAYQWAGSGALLSHDTSGILFDLDGLRGRTIEVSTPRRLESARVIVHQRNTEGLARQTIGPVMVTSIEQTLLDLGAVLAAERLELAFDSALRQGRTRYERVVKHFQLFGGRGVPGSVALAKLLDARRPCPRPTHSELEVDFLQLTRAFGLPPAAGQFPVTLSNGRRVQIDFAYRGERLAIEVDSVRWHSGVRAIKWDNERQNLLVALGWRVLRFEWNDVLYRPEMVAEQILDALVQEQLGFDLG
ncbi:MAG: endonuclease domain-containing protein, partial [Actinomycetota bacterium]